MAVAARAWRWAPCPLRARAEAKDIVDTAVAAGQFKTLAAPLQAAGLADTLKGPGPFAVFAPSDEAFAKLPAGTVEALLQDIPKLTPVPSYHVVKGHGRQRPCRSGRHRLQQRGDPCDRRRHPAGQLNRLFRVTASAKRTLRRCCAPQNTRPDTTRWERSTKGILSTVQTL